MEYVVRLDGLEKAYRRLGRSPRVALTGLDLEVRCGEVHGFLGPNGSGKTTALRVLLGLARATAGRAWLFERPVPHALPAVADRVGVVLETPQFFPNFTARRTLRLLATAGGVPSLRVDEVLDLVGLSAHANEQVQAYSLGMRQRLALAAAMLKSPELLVMDEPANGLDPAGVLQLRELVGELAADGTTVLLSSHAVGDVQRLCDAVTVVSRGRRVAAGPVAKVLAAADRGEYLVRVPEPTRAAEIMSRAGLPVRVHDDHVVVGDLSDASWITETLAAHGLWVSELTPLRPDLTDVFLDLTDAESDLAPSSWSADPTADPTAGLAAGLVAGPVLDVAPPNGYDTAAAGPATGRTIELDLDVDGVAVDEGDDR